MDPGLSILPTIDPAELDDGREYLDDRRNRLTSQLSRLAPRSAAFADRLMDELHLVDDVLEGALPKRTVSAEQGDRVRADCERFTRRRRQELAVADRFSALATSTGEALFATVAEKSAACHTSFDLYENDDTAELRYAWDQKCHQSKLCPHEARAAANEFIESYAALILWLLALVPDARLQYWVISPPHVDPDDLAEAKRSMQKQVARALGKLRAAGTILGAFVTQEDPVAIGGRQFNVHFNLLVITRSRWPQWSEIRRDFFFGWHCFFEDQRGMVKRSAKRLQRLGLPMELLTTHECIRFAIMEVVKYSAKLVGAADKHRPPGDPKDRKNRQHREAKDAPPMVEWSDTMLATWWRANHRPNFRRTATYGHLFHGTKIGVADPPELVAAAAGAPLPDATVETMGKRIAKAAAERGWDLADLAAELARRSEPSEFRWVMRLTDWWPRERSPDGRRRKPRSERPQAPTAAERETLARTLEVPADELFGARGVSAADLVPIDESDDSGTWQRVGSGTWSPNLGEYRPFILIKAVKSPGDENGAAPFEPRAGPDPPSNWPPLEAYGAGNR